MGEWKSLSALASCHSLGRRPEREARSTKDGSGETLQNIPGLRFEHRENTAPVRGPTRIGGTMSVGVILLTNAGPSRKRDRPLRIGGMGFNDSSSSFAPPAHGRNNGPAPASSRTTPARLPVTCPTCLRLWRSNPCCWRRTRGLGLGWSGSDSFSQSSANHTIRDHACPFARQIKVCCDSVLGCRRWRCLSGFGSSKPGPRPSCKGGGSICSRARLPPAG